MHVWGRAKETKQGSQRGTWQHSQPATHMEQFMAHSQHHMAGSKPITHMLHRVKKTKQGSQEGHMPA